MNSARSIRQAQAIVPNGVGAIVDVKGESFIINDTSKWTFARPGQGTEVSSPQLRDLLGVQRFYAPPIRDANLPEWKESNGPALPVTRFPSWLFCGSCRRMKKWQPVDEESNPGVKCSSCQSTQPYVPMRWVQVCADGHIQDVDWRWFAHAGKKSDCKKVDALKFSAAAITTRAESGLSTLSISCTSCGSSRSMGDLSDTDLPRKIGLQCRGLHPWDYSAIVDDGCQAETRIVQRRAGNVYYPRMHSALEVPHPDHIPVPWLVLAEANPLFVSISQSIVDGSMTVDEARTVIQTIARQTGIETQELEQEFLRRSATLPEVDTGLVSSRKSVAEAEWLALTSPHIADLKDFKTRHVSIASPMPTSSELELQSLVSRVVLIDTLREVRAFEGFHRLRPAGTETFMRADGRRYFEKPRQSWLPAVEVRGEGIFVALKASALKTWENSDAVQARVASLERRAQQSFMSSRFKDIIGDQLSPRFVLIHTLAHLLIRQLAFESGYGASSLRERVYARQSDQPDLDQAGFLIYTAAGDAEGTLGGLVRQGESPRLSRTILEALESGAWCSSDPLCSEQDTSALDGLNLAACHACCLVSETSCETGNYLLDRQLVIGGKETAGFFSTVLGILERETTDG